MTMSFLRFVIFYGILALAGACGLLYEYAVGFADIEVTVISVVTLLIGVGFPLETLLTQRKRQKKALGSALEDFKK